MAEHRRPCPECRRMCQPAGYDGHDSRVWFRCCCGVDFTAETRADYLAGVGDREAAEAARVSTRKAADKAERLLKRGKFDREAAEAAEEERGP